MNDRSYLVRHAPRIFDAAASNPIAAAARNVSHRDSMTWIETRNPLEDTGALRAAFDAQRSQYPAEYALPAMPSASGAAGIVASHSLIPEALHHAFGTFGALMNPSLPLERRHHEMIATVVSVTNRCRY